MNPKQGLGGAVAATLGASLCCVAPLVLLALGIGGTWIAVLTQLEPLRPIFVAATAALLGWTWWKLYRVPVACTPDERCADAAVLRRQKTLFWIIAPLLLGILAFPWYASFFY